MSKENILGISGNQKMTKAYHLAGEAATEAMDNFKKEAKTRFKAKKKEADVMASKAKSLVAERPILTIGCAFGAGWLASKIFK